MCGCPSNCGLDLCCITWTDDRDGNSSGLVARPVKAVILAADGIGSYGIAERRNELLQCRLHADQIIPARAAALAGDVGRLQPGELQLILAGTDRLELMLQLGQTLEVTGHRRHLFVQCREPLVEARYLLL